MENCWREPPQSSGDYYPHYSLFRSSFFYDTDNIRIASLTCKYDSLTTESGIRTFEYRKSSVELDIERRRTVSGPECPEDLARSAEPPDRERRHTGSWPKGFEDLARSKEPPDKENIERCHTVSESKCSEGLPRKAEPLDKEYIERWYSQFAPNWSNIGLDNLVRNIEPTNEKDMSGPKWPVDLARSAESPDKEDLEGRYTLFGPKRSDNLIRSSECTVKKDMESFNTVSGPKWPLDLACSAASPDKEDLEGGYTLFGPKRSDNLIHCIERTDKKDIESFNTVSGPKWPADLACSADSPDRENIEEGYTLFGPKRSDNLVCSIEHSDKTESFNTVSGPKWPLDLACSAESPDREDIGEGYTLFGPKRSDNLVRSIEPTVKEDKQSSGIVFGPKWSLDLAYNAEPPKKENIEGGYTLFGPKRSDNLVRSVEPRDKERCRTVSGPMWPVDLACSAEPSDKEDMEGWYTLFGHTWSEDPVRSIELPVKENKERCRTVSEPVCSEYLARSAELLDIKKCHNVSWPKCFKDLADSTEPPVKEATKRCRTVSEPERSEDLVCRAEPQDTEDKINEEKVGPDPDKRIITKKELYRDPDLFQSRSEYVEPIAPQPKKPKSWGYYDWTRQIWVHKVTGKRVPMNKREEMDEEQRQAWGEAWREERRGEWRRTRGGSQPGHPLAEPHKVHSGGADNMTQKVGWQGGALGRGGDANHHPTAKDSNNASLSASFGKRTSAKARAKKLSALEVFRTNVLLFIMEFVKDDTEVQLQFESELKQSERRQIKTIVSHIITAGNIELLGSVGQYELVLDIQGRNQYPLLVASEGDDVTRFLSIYKEAPAHVYLVTPEDFLPKEEGDEPEEQSSETYTIQGSSDPDNEDNPFLRSIEKGLKKKTEKQCNMIEREKRTESTPEKKMLEFFLEFGDSELFTEMWFLGKFTEKQVQVINELLNDVSNCIDDFDSFDGDKEMAKVFMRAEVQFELREGSNGTAEIHKVPANPPTEEQVTQPGPKAGP